MKKSLLALAVLGAFAGAAQAQSAVTIYGSFDGGVRHSTNVNAAGDNRLTMGSTGTYNSNRLGFKGVEDLGGGMNAHFTLETGFNTGTGALDAANTLFNRTAAVGLGGAWGSLDLGRQYTVPFKTIASYDPFSYKYPGIADAVASTAGVRYNNNIQYIGTFGGAVTVRAEYALGEVAGDTGASSAKSIGGTYVAGPLSVGAAYNLREDATGTLDTDHWTIGGAYKFGAARATVGYVSQTAESATGDAKTRWTWVGLNYAVSPTVELTGAFYKTKLSGTSTGDKDNLMIGATYALSKRTNLYGLLTNKKFDGAATALSAGNSRQRDIAVGVNHLF